MSTYPPIAEPPKSSGAKIVLWILGILGALFLAVVLACGGAIWWLMQPIQASAKAKEPLAVESVPLPDFSNAQTGEMQTIAAGVRRRVVTLGDGSGYGQPPGANMRLFVYLPEGNIAPGSLPCVLIGGAGSTPFDGMLLSEGDEPEHVPYVNAGMAVVAFDIDGPNDGEGDEGEALQKSYAQLRAALGGVTNARNALEYTLKSVPEVNSKQIFIAGHSSAGTLALLFAEHEPRLAGCVAFAPVVNKLGFLPDVLVRTLSMALSGLPDFLAQTSPETHVARMYPPVFLFHAEDDLTVNVSESRKFADALKAAGKDVILETVPSGDHYEAMINEGQKKAIEWIQARTQAK